MLKRDLFAIANLLVTFENMHIPLRSSQACDIAQSSVAELQIMLLAESSSRWTFWMPEYPVAIEQVRRCR